MGLLKRRYLNKAKDNMVGLILKLNQYEARTSRYLPRAQDNEVDGLEKKIKILREGRREALDDLAEIEILEKY